MPVTPDYAGPRNAPPEIGLYRMGLFFAVAPLVTGVTILISYLLTEWEPLLTAGLFTLVAGVLSVTLSTILIAVYRYGARYCDASTAAKVRSRVRGVVFIIFVNFPAAYGCFYVGGRHAVRVMSTYTVIVTNKGSTPVTSVVLTGPGSNINIGPIGPGKTAFREMTFSSDGALAFDVTVNGRHVTGTADGYVSREMGGRCRITINGQQVTTSP